MVKTYGELYLSARRALMETEGDNAAQSAREVLAYVSGKSTASVIVDRDLYASEQIEKKLNDCLARMIAGEPLAYILGQWSFYGMDLTVTPDVLIPRDDTMAVTDLAIAALRNMPAPQRVLDLCTGSGCIGLAIAHQISTARVTLADISQAALKVAKKNLSDLKLTGRVTTFEVDVRQEAPKFLGQFDLIVSNPPYVTRQEMQELEPSVRFYEPHLALDGGEDGLDFYRDILQNYSQSLKPGGKLCFEFGLSQHMAVGALLAESGFTNIQFAKDYRSVIRAVIAEK